MTPEDVYASWSASPSPDGSLIAFVSDRSGDPGLWIHGPAMRIVNPLPSAWARVLSVSWSPDGQWLACGTAAPGASREEVWLVRPDGTDPHRVAGRGGTALLGDGPWHGWTRDNRLLVTESNGTEATAMLLSTDGSREVLDVGPQRLLLHAEAGRALIRVGPRGRRHLELLDGPTRTPVDVGAGPGLTDRGFLSLDGRTVYARTNVGRQFAALVRVRPYDTPDYGVDDGVGDAASGPEVVAERAGAELEAVTPTPDGSRAVLLWNVSGGRSSIGLLDLAAGTGTTGTGTTGAGAAGPELPVDGLPRDVIDEVRLHPDGASLLLTAEGWSDPQGIWSLPLPPAQLPPPPSRPSSSMPSSRSRPSSRSMPSPSDSPEAVPLSSPDDGSLRASRGASSPRVGTSELSLPQLRRFAARDGLELTGWLYRPAADGPLPTVIYLHGGPEAQERPVYNSLFQTLVDAGIAVFALNFRGSTGLGRSFQEADDLDRRFAAIDDVADAAGYLTATGAAESGRLGCMGRSYGGYLTLAALVWHPDLFAAGVDVCGMSDFETFYAHTEPWIGAAAESEYGHPVHDVELLRSLSPIHRIDKLVAPLLVVHGAEDTNVPVVEAEQVVAALAARDAPHRYLLFPGEGHDLLATPNRVTFVRESVGWFAAHLS